MHKTLYENEFLAIREVEGYSYYHMTRTNGKMIAILPYQRTDNTVEYLARVEICPAHSLDLNTYSITGGISEGEAPEEAAKRETLEESGYDVDVESLESMGTVRPSKQTDTVVYLFAVDVTGKTQQEISGDGTRWETGAGVKWVSFEEGISIVDPLFITILARLRYKHEG